MAACAALALTSTAQAIEIYPMKEFSTSIYITGNIEYGDEAFLLKVLQERQGKGQATEFAVLNSPGGNMHAGMEMALLMKGWGIKTVVGADEACASACMLMYAGGVQRYAWRGALLGVHGASTTINGYTEDTGDGTVRLAKMMAFLGAPDSVIALLVVTSSDDMTWLDNQAVQGWVQLLDPRNEQREEQQTTTTTTTTTGNKNMTCRSTESGIVYQVTLGDANIVVNGKLYQVNEQHAATKETGAWVATGPTRWGKYGAVFYGPNPRMAFINTKGEKAVDRCW